jgi:hypothetical protein
MLHAGVRRTILMNPDDRFCANCARGFINNLNLVSCGAPVDDLALTEGGGVNPVWAERKYSKVRVMLLLANQPTNDKGTDCDKMELNDGATCKMWKHKEEQV